MRSFEEIAAELNMSVPQVEAICYRAMNKIRAQMSTSIAQKGKRLLAELDGGATEFRVAHSQRGF